MSNNLQEQIEKERQQAREACSVDSESSDCAAAWDVVEELQAEAAHKKSSGPKKNSLEKYCDDNPEAAECRIYDD